MVPGTGGYLMTSAEDIYATTRRPRSRWLVWTACFLMAFDVFILPAWAITLGAALMGFHGQVDVDGRVIPMWFDLLQGALALLSVVGIAAIALQTNALGFRVVSAVAVAWVVFYTDAWAAGAWDAGPIAYRVVILALLFLGRGSFRPEPAGGPIPTASAS